MTQFEKIITTCKRDLGRIGRLMVLLLLIGWASNWIGQILGHPELAPLFTSLYAILIITVVTHIARRMLFHRLDLQSIALEAASSGTGAGLVFVGICLVFCTIVYTTVLMMH